MTHPRITSTVALSCRVPIRLMQWLDAQALEQGRTRSNMTTVLLLRAMQREQETQDKELMSPMW